VVGIGLCTGVIVASLSFVCYQRLTLHRLRAKQDTQTPAYRALVAGKHKQADVKQDSVEMTLSGRLEPRSPHVNRTCSRATQRTAAIKISTTSAIKQHDQLTPSSARRHTTPSPLMSTRAAAQLSIFQPRTPVCNDSPARRSNRASSRSPREAFECMCLVAGSGGLLDHDTFVLETRPPVEGRDSLSVEQVLDTAATEQQSSELTSVELKTANYVAPTECSVAVRRCLERVEQPSQVTRATSPMSTSDVDVLPDISVLLTSGTETDEVDDDDVVTMTGAPSSSSLSDLVADCDVELDSDDCRHRPHTTSFSAVRQQRLHKAPWTSTSPWTARKHQRNVMLEPDIYYC